MNKPLLALRLDHLNAYWRLMRADKPIGIYLLLWPTIWAVLLASFQDAAEQLPNIGVLSIFVMGVVLMRSAGCVINDYADRHFDKAVERTKSRPLTTGEVSTTEALQLFSLLVLIAFLLVMQLNIQTILLSIVAVLLASIYPFMKRYTHFPQVVLGAAFGWSIPMASMAILETIPSWVWWMYFANLCWTVAYDTQYAMVDREDDVKVGIKSTAIYFGKYDLIVIAILQVVFLTVMTYLAYRFNLVGPVYIALLIAFGMTIRQWKNTRTRNKKACFEAFLNNHKVGMVIAIGLFASILLAVA